MRVRHCPTCRTDYRPDIVCCADCGGPLTDRDDEQDEGSAAASAAAPAASGVDDLPEGFVPIATSREIDALAELADALVGAGVDCRIREYAREAHPTGYRLFVHARDRESAVAVQQRQAPAPDDAGFDPRHGYMRCPACGASLPPQATQCPECELLLAQTELFCPVCGAVAAATAEQCSECGASLEEAD